MTLVALFLLFLDGVLAFFSPCILHMLPLYLAYLTGTAHNKRRMLKVASGFWLGLFVLFSVMGALTSSLSDFFTHRWWQIGGGMLITVFGFYFLFRKSERCHCDACQHHQHPIRKDVGFWQAVLFGITAGASWSPCMVAFLGSALVTASETTSLLLSMLGMSFFALGFGMWFFLVSFVCEKSKAVVLLLEEHQKLIHTIAGAFLLLMGVLMMTGWIEKLEHLLGHVH